MDRYEQADQVSLCSIP